MKSIYDDKRLQKAVNSFLPVCKLSDGMDYPTNETGNRDRNSMERFHIVERLEPLKFSDEGLKKCIERATVDITPRTMGVSHAGTPNYMFFLAMKISSDGQLLKNLKEWLAKGGTETEFDEWHQNACIRILDVLRNEFNDNVQYGKAQKVLNMTMKIVYSLLWVDMREMTEPEKQEQMKEIESRLAYAHIPLDSFTLEWFKRKKKGKSTLRQRTSGSKSYRKFAAGGVPSWSSLSYSQRGEHFLPEELTLSGKWEYTYNFIVDEVRSLFSGENGIYGSCGGTLSEYTPLQAEFFIWDEMQLTLAVEGFVSKLKDYIDDESEETADALKSKSLEEKIRLALKSCIGYLNIRQSDGTVDLAKLNSILG